MISKSVSKRIERTQLESVFYCQTYLHVLLFFIFSFFLFLQYIYFSLFCIQYHYPKTCLFLLYSFFGLNVNQALILILSYYLNYLTFRYIFYSLKSIRLINQLIFIEQFCVLINNLQLFIYFVCLFICFFYSIFVILICLPSQNKFLLRF